MSSQLKPTLADSRRISPQLPQQATDDQALWSPYFFLLLVNILGTG